MYRKDYVLRLIEEFSKFMSILLKLKKEERFEQAELAVAEAIQKFTETDLNFLLSIPEKDLLIEVAEKRKLNEETLQILAELLYQSAEIKKLLGAGEEDLQAYYRRSLALFKWLQQHQQKVFSIEILRRIELLESLVSQGS